MRIRTLAVLTLMPFLLSACASGTTATLPTQLVPPEFIVSQIDGVGAAARHMSGALPVHFLVEVRNPSGSWIQLDRLHVETLGSGAYTIRPYSKPFEQRIESMETAVVEIWAPALAEDTISGVNGPVTLRMMAQFDSEFGAFQRVIVTQVNDSMRRRSVR